MDTPSATVLQSAGLSVKIEEGPNEITAYANIVAILVSPDEVLLHFGLRRSDDPNKGIGVAKIYMTSAHAKRLMAALSGSIQKIEEVFGEIVADPVLQLTPEQLQKLQKDKPGI
jgi:hypothetical protein